MSKLRFALVQMAAVWENPAATRTALEQYFSRIANGSVDLIILPETFSTGFTNSSAEFSESMSGETVDWMKSNAEEKKAVVAGSIIISERGNNYNRLIFAFPDGRIEHYDKHHLFTLSKEHENFTAGNDRKLIEVNGWKIFPQICYDLRFPVWARNNLNYDLMLYVANWPSPRKEAWRSLLVARAIENQAYVIGVNRIGSDANQLDYHGNSACIDYTGKRVHEMNREEEIAIVTVEKEPMMLFRSKLAFLDDQDKFEFRN